MRVSKTVTVSCDFKKCEATVAVDTIDKEPSIPAGWYQWVGTANNGVVHIIDLCDLHLDGTVIKLRGEPAWYDYRVKN